MSFVITAKDRHGRKVNFGIDITGTACACSLLSEAYSKFSNRNLAERLMNNMLNDTVAARDLYKKNHEYLQNFTDFKVVRK